MKNLKKSMLPLFALLYPLVIPFFILSCAEDSSMPPDSQNVIDCSECPWQSETTNIDTFKITSISGFRGPYGITVSESGNYYVPDIRDGKIIQFSAENSFEQWLGYSADLQRSGWFTSFLSVETGHEQSLIGAHSIEFDLSNNIIVADFFGNKVLVYNEDGSFRFFLNQNPTDETLSFIGVANVIVDQFGNIWASDWSGHRVFKFDSSFRFLGWLGEPDGSEAINVGFSQSGHAIASNRLGGLNKPHMVQVDSEGYVYVVETGNNRVQKFTPDGISIGWFGVNQDGNSTQGYTFLGTPAPSDQNGGFINPVSLQLTEENEFIIADNGNHRIQKFDYDGNFLGWIGGSESQIYLDWTTAEVKSVLGSENGYLSAPFHAIYKGGKLFIADGHNNRVQIYQNYLER